MRAARPPPFPHQAEARMAVFEFIEGWYNPIAVTPPSTICRQSTTKGVTTQSSQPQALRRPLNRGSSTLQAADFVAYEVGKLSGVLDIEEARLFERFRTSFSLISGIPHKWKALSELEIRTELNLRGLAKRKRLVSYLGGVRTAFSSSLSNFFRSKLRSSSRSFSSASRCFSLIGFLGFDCFLVTAVF